MKRRSFAFLSGTGMVALGIGKAAAQASDPTQLLKTTLTPMGAERAGNADGSIPAWTGGYTTIPAGWSPGQDMPDMFAGDQPVAVVDAGNMAQHADRLTESIKFMIQKWGFSLKIYPTRRTASAPQKVYDAIAVNAVNAKLDPAGGRIGFSGAYGGVPFPVPDSDPSNAGAQIMWNNNCLWQGYQQSWSNANYVISSGGAPVLSNGSLVKYKYDYYDPNGSLENWNGWLNRVWVKGIAPSVNVGSYTVFYASPNALKKSAIAWTLLPGQGRVRRAPNLKYDTPNSYSDGVANYDESYGFNGSLDEYDWKLVAKKEMYIPYNNNKMRFVKYSDILGPKFCNPDLVRWELHRVWVVEGTLHEGRRNVLPRRVFYVDEDTWDTALGDCYDAGQNLYKAEIEMNLCRPDAPGTIPFWSFTHNLQTGDYTLASGCFAEAPFTHGGPDYTTPVAENLLDPNLMAAEASY